MSDFSFETAHKKILMTISFIVTASADKLTFEIKCLIVLELAS